MNHFASAQYTQEYISGTSQMSFDASGAYGQAYYQPAQGYYDECYPMQMQQGYESQAYNDQSYYSGCGYEYSQDQYSQSQYGSQWGSSWQTKSQRQKATARLNLDDFSDVSDSDSESDAEEMIPAAKTKAKEDVELPPGFAPESTESAEPFAEPSPCQRSSKEDTDDDDKTSGVEDEEKELSSAASEPEAEIDEIETCSERSPSESAPFFVEELLKWRAVAGCLAPEQAIYTTKGPAEKEKTSSKATDEGSWRQQVPAAPKKVLEVSDNSWAAQQHRRKAATSTGDEQVARAVKSILNKLTVEKFSGLFRQLLDCGISSAVHVELLIHEVFEKATTQHHFIDMYADLCVLLHEHFMQKPFAETGANGKPLSFKKLLLDECQASFERLLTPPESVGAPGSEEQSLAEAKYKTHMLGNIMLVGALLSRGMLAGKVAIAIMEELLSNPTPEALESIAALLTAVGATFDRPDWQYQKMLSHTFERIKVIVKERTCQPRERCLLKDLLDLRATGWKDLRPKRTERPTTLDEVKDQAINGPAAPTPVRKVLVSKTAADVASRLRPANNKKPFDEESFRSEIQKVFVELRNSRDDKEALLRLQSMPAPPASKQPTAVSETLSFLVQESSAEVRKLGFKCLACLMQGAWHIDSLSRGLQHFLKEAAEDLHCDVPALPRILKEELAVELAHLAKTGLLQATDLEALKSF
mmetsp:Transcript_61867/g.109901  ORF Transcript_61867/g.109901 Transcript_61867/m.109901 type:complete len:700 (-) Transcript_61867:87-2186(-)